MSGLVGPENGVLVRKARMRCRSFVLVDAKPILVRHFNLAERRLLPGSYKQTVQKFPYRTLRKLSAMRSLHLFWAMLWP